MKIPKSTITDINAAIKALENTKKIITAFEDANGFIKTVAAKGRGTWVIEDNRYFQFVRVDGNSVILNRRGSDQVFLISQFNSMFRLADAAQVAQHELYLKNSGGSQLTDKEFVGYKLQASKLGFQRAVEEIIGFPFPKVGYVTETSKAWTNIKAAGIQIWFEKAFEKIKVEPAAAEPAAFDPNKCDFYLVTCRGIRGAKVRHATIELALAEATRIANVENHEAWVVGVVTSVKPS